MASTAPLAVVPPVAPPKAPQVLPVADEWSDLTEEFLLGLRAAGRSPRTEQAYRYALDDLRTFLGPTANPQAVTALDLNRWLMDRRERRSAVNAAFLLRHARPFFRWGGRVGLIDGDPFARVAVPKVPTKVVPTLSDRDLKALLDACAGPDWRSRRDRALIRVLLDTGIRRGEAVRLQVDDLDLASGVLHIRLSKSGRARMVPLGVKARRDLRAWLRARQQYLTRSGHPERGPLFIGQQGLPFTPSGLYQSITTRMRQAGVSADRAVHVFRHTFATRALEAGASELDVMSVAGWSSTTLLQRYTASTQTARALASHATWGLGDRL